MDKIFLTKKDEGLINLPAAWWWWATGADFFLGWFIATSTPGGFDERLALSPHEE
jgi:hypothetical protein